MSFFAELRRRKIFKVGAAYLVVAWLVVQVTGTLLPMFDAPAWVARSIVIVIAVGLVPALVFTWMFELTPLGIKRETEIVPAAPLVSGAAQRAGAASTADAARIDSIAVLPFQARNSDADTEYLSDGLAESLIYRLSRLSGMKVSPTSRERTWGSTTPWGGLLRALVWRRSFRFVEPSRFERRRLERMRPAL